MDLDINNYNLNEILSLFKLPLNFDEQQLKNAKKIVLKTHPDKSGLQPEYFLFYSKAYKIVYSIYKHKNKSDKNANTELVEEYSMLESQNKVLDTFFESNNEMKDPKKFNKWFNQQFENHATEQQHEGYGDWLKTDEGLYKTDKTTSSNINADFEKHKKQIKSLVVYNGIDDVYSSGGMGGTLLGEGSGDYSSSLFSNLAFQDIKQAFVETIIPVSEEDLQNVKQYKNVNEYAKYRESQNVEPLTELEAKRILNSKEQQEEVQSSQRAYYYAKQMEEATKQNKKFWGGLQSITYR